MATLHPIQKQLTVGELLGRFHDLLVSGAVTVETSIQLAIRHGGIDAEGYLATMAIERDKRLVIVGQSEHCGIKTGAPRTIRGHRYRIVHGMYGTPEYRAWRNMLARCHNKRWPGYHRYGGRGVRVCERWNEFANFFEDMGPRPSPRHSLHRLKKHYEPGSVVWETTKIQTRARCSNRFLTLNGERLCFADWAAKTGICTRTIRERLASGWSIKKSLTTPPDRRYARPIKTALISYRCVTLTRREWAKRLGLKYRCFCERLRKSGWALEKIFTLPKQNNQFG